MLILKKETYQKNKKSDKIIMQSFSLYINTSQT